MERLATPPLHPITEVDSFVVAAHPASTNGQLAKTWAAILQAAEPNRKVSFISTEGCDPDANRELVVSGIQASYDEGHTKPLFISAGGDGSLHYNGLALLHPSTPKHVAETLITPWQLGMACDGYRSLHARETYGSPLTLLEHPDGHVVESNPLLVRTIADGEISEDIAFLYATFGPSANALHKLETPKHRAWRGHFPPLLHKAVDSAAAAPIVLSGPQRVDATLGKATDIHRVVEAEFINGTSMAGRADFSRSTQLGDRALHYAEIRHRNPVAASWFAGRLAVGLPPGERTENPAVLTFRDGTLHGQIDGEALRNQGGKQANVRAVWVAPSSHIIRYYATKKYPQRPSA